MGDYLKAEQIEQLLKGINKARVSKDNDGFSHLEAWDVRAHLNRIFGFARWSAEVVELVCAYEEETTTREGKPAFRVGYRATVALTIMSPNGSMLAHYTEAAFGQSVMPATKRGDAHDMAIKTAESQALKRCAVNLGDQFGLSLYQDGNTGAVVKDSLVKPESEEPAEKAEVTEETAKALKNLGVVND